MILRADRESPGDNAPNKVCAAVCQRCNYRMTARTDEAVVSAAREHVVYAHSLQVWETFMRKVGVVWPKP